jgi:hypothetical protein
MEAYRERAGKAPLILHLGTRWRQDGPEAIWTFVKDKNFFPLPGF